MKLEEPIAKLFFGQKSVIRIKENKLIITWGQKQRLNQFFEAHIRMKTDNDVNKILYVLNQWVK